MSRLFGFCLLTLGVVANGQAELDREAQKSCLHLAALLPVIPHMPPELVDSRENPEQVQRLFEPGGYTLLIEAMEELADDGLAEAQWSLAILHQASACGLGDSDLAMDLYRRAADQGYARAYQSLGIVYMEGDLKPQDLVEAYKWHWLAVDAGRSQAEANLDTLSGKLTAAQVQDARQKADRWQAAHDPHMGSAD